MKQWEYLRISEDHEGRIKFLENLNIFGEAGWEIINVHCDSIYHVEVAFLKRELRKEYFKERRETALFPKEDTNG